MSRLGPTPLLAAVLRRLTTTARVELGGPGVRVAVEAPTRGDALHLARELLHRATSEGAYQ